MDIDHLWGGDLAVSTTGDLALVDGSDLTRQRILRRLMTARHGYIWHPEYGAGVPQMIGSPLDPASVRAAVRAQIMMERAVARNPLPQIEVTRITSGLYCHITFWNADTGAQEVLRFDYSL